MRTWSGPPRLLVLATLLALSIAPLLPDDDPVEAGGVHLSSSKPGTVTDPAVGAVERGELSAARKRSAPKSPPPVDPPRRKIGVVSYNLYRGNSTRQHLADARKLARDPRVDIIAWQEAYETGAAHAALRDLGWRTRRFPQSARELAVSWRQDRWSFVSAQVRKVANGMSPSVARYPFPDRWAVRVTLRQRDTRQQLSVINTHLPQKIEDLTNPGRWADTFNAARARRQLARLKHLWDGAPGRWVIGAGDYNVDARAEADVRPQEGLSRVMAGRGVSSFAELGLRGLSGPTHPTSGRYIDYVFASRRALRSKQLAFVSHRVLRSFNSDHRPLLARIALD